MSTPAIFTALDKNFSGLLIRGLVTNVDTVGNGAGATTALHTYTLPAGSLGQPGDSIDFEYLLSFAGNTGSQITVRFGTTTIMDTGVINPALTGVVVYGRVTRVTETTQKATAWIGGSGVGVFSHTACTEDLATDLALSVRGLGVSENDVLKESAIVNYRGSV